MELKKRVYVLEKENELLKEQVRALDPSAEHPRKRQRKIDAEDINHTSGSQQTPQNTISRTHSGLDGFDTVFNAFCPVADGEQ
jgi:hypothetical protein